MFLEGQRTTMGDRLMWTVCGRMTREMNGIANHLDVSGIDIEFTGLRECSLHVVASTE